MNLPQCSIHILTKKKSINIDRHRNRNTLKSKLSLEATRNRNHFFASSDKRASPTAVGSSRPPFPVKEVLTQYGSRAPTRMSVFHFGLRRVEAVATMRVIRRLNNWIPIARATLVLINLIFVMELLLGNSSNSPNRTGSLHERFNQCPLPPLSESNTSVMRTSTMEVSEIVNYVYFGRGVSCHIIHSFGGAIVPSPSMIEEAYWIDGGYNLCMDRGMMPDRRRGCLVYSVGINNDWTFDETMERYGVRFRPFDEQFGPRPYGQHPLLPTGHRRRKRGQTSDHRLEVAHFGFHLRHVATAPRRRHYRSSEN